MLDRTAVVATSYSRDTLFLHGWGPNCNPLRLALYESAGMTAKLSLYSTDCNRGTEGSEFERRMHLAVPIDSDSGSRHELRMVRKENTEADAMTRTRITPKPDRGAVLRNESPAHPESNACTPFPFRSKERLERARSSLCAHA